VPEVAEKPFVPLRRSAIAAGTVAAIEQILQQKIAYRTKKGATRRTPFSTTQNAIFCTLCGGDKDTKV
jgi:hypothetical protein